MPESGTTDSATTDSMQADSGLGDVGVTDGSAADSETTDSAPGDSATDGAGGDTGSPDAGASDSGLADSGAADSAPHDAAMTDTGLPDGAIVVVTSTIYANTDDTLYSLDPSTQLVTEVGVFSGLPDAGNHVVTDVAVNAAGAVYVNTESAVYSAALPATPGPTAKVALTLLSNIAATASTYFYALGFTTSDALGVGTGEVLIGGDNNGELWSINTVTGATQDLGNFGPDSAHPGNVFALSGDVVFYTDGVGNPTGLATIRSCNAGSRSTCLRTSDFLAGIDMTALAAAYTGHTPAPSLLAGIYGGTATTSGPGTSYGDLYGLGVWSGNVFAFSRSISSPAVPPLLLTIDTTSGVGTPVTGQTWSFTNGWSGAGVTTTVTVTIPKPPPGH